MRVRFPRTLPAYVAAVALALLGIPSLYSVFYLAFGVPDGLDTSWMVDTVLAVRHHQVFGRSFIWTYGPLGFLDVPMAVSRALLVVTDGVQIALAVGAALIAVWFVTSYLRWSVAWAWAFVLVLFLPATLPGPVQTGVEFLGPVLAALILVAAMAETRVRVRYSAIALAGLLAVTGALTKDNALPVAGVLLLSAAGALWARGDRRGVIALLSACLVEWIAAFSLADGRLATGAVWLRAIIPLVSGYSAMSLSGPFSYLWTALGCIVLLVGASVWSLRRGPQVGSADWLLPAAVMTTAVVFKEGFVREDEHVLDFFRLLPWCCLILAGWLRSRGTAPAAQRRVRPVFAVAAIVCAIMVVARTQTVVPSAAVLSTKLQQAADAVRWATSFTWRDQAWIRESTQATALYAGLSTIEPTIAHQTALAWPWDGNAVVAAGATEVPPPVPQGYSAYEPVLDRIDANFFRSPRRPRYALVVPEAIDGALPLQTAPDAFRALLRCYRPVQVSGMFVLAAARPCAPVKRALDSKWRSVGLDAWVPLPDRPGQLIYARVIVGPSPVGNLLGLVLRRAPTYLRIRLSDGAVQQYRLVSATSGDGILVSAVIDSPTALYRLWLGYPGAETQAVSVVAGNAADWRGTVRVQFMSVPDPKWDRRLALAIQACLPPVDRGGSGAALRALAYVYMLRPDLQAAFGAPGHLSVPALFRWAASAGITVDSARPQLRPYAAELRRLAQVRLAATCSTTA